MFTEEVPQNEAEAFSQAFSLLLGVPLISKERLNARTRQSFLAAARNCRCHLFLDPDTGLYIGKRRCSKATHLSLSELVDIACSRPHLLTLVFDQCFDRRQKREEQLRNKLRALAVDGVHGIAYHSHACFLLVGCDANLVEHARDVLLQESHFPPERFIPEHNPRDDRMPPPPQRAVSTTVRCLNGNLRSG